ncbi:MAG: acetate--CoA ligase family protein [Planctomycetes bacterium]|nr:acetate--CoA ligase family protein [Planctomycetota bacterium]
MVHVHTQGLDGLFRPRSVAVVGASRRDGSIGGQVVRNLVMGGFQGPVYPVNPKAEVVCSVPAHKSVKAIPGPVDLAVLAVPPDLVLAVAAECGRKGVKGLVVITAGFREIGGAGVEREQKLAAISRRYGMRVIGPNCMGILNTDPAYRCNASFASTAPAPGSVAMVSQSGALGEAVLADAARAGLGVAMFASVGNRVDVTAADLVAYWGEDDQVKVILLYLETVGEPHDFVQVARQVARKKPIIAVKSGRSDAGARAASSHTGSIAGIDLAVNTMLRQCGVLRVDNFRDMFALAQALLMQPLPRGRRMAIVTNAGGPGILATDALDGLGLEMADLAPATVKALRKVLPVEASLRNPIDLIASADADRYRKTLRIVTRDPGIDGLVLLFVSPIMIDAASIARVMVEETAGYGKPVLAGIMGRRGGDEAHRLLDEAGIPKFRYPEDAAMTLRLMCRRHEWLARRPVRVPALAVDLAQARRILRQQKEPGWLPQALAERLLQAYGIPFAASRRAGTAGDAVAAAHKLGFPVVLKAVSAGLLHKSEHHAVRTGLRTGDDVFAAASDLIKRLGGEFADLSLQVQKNADGHREVLLGVTRDERYGTLFAVGLGGVHVEALRDVSLRTGPLDGRDPIEMFGELNGAVLLDAFRGDPAADKKAAANALLRLQRLVTDFPRIQEVEVNPFIVAAPGGNSLAVDARVRVGAR